MEAGPAWDALWRQGGKDVFQSHGWIAAWWNSRQADDGSRLCLGLCWTEDRLAAVLPFATRRRRGVRVLEWAAKECSDYCDALIDPDLGEGWRALEQVWAAVVAAGAFDLAYLSHVRPDAALHALLGRRPQSLQLRPGRRSASSRQVRYGASDGRAWFDGLNKATRDGHARGMQALSEIGPIRSEMHTHAAAADGLIDGMIGLKRRQLANTGQGYAILDNDASAFRALATELARQRMLQLFSMHCGDRLVAASLSIASGKRMQVFFASCDPYFGHAETLALVEFIIATLGNGITEVDLLCVEDGSEYAFTNAQVSLASYVSARTLAGRLALALGERRA